MLATSACSKFESYDGPQVTRVVVVKEARTLYLLNEEGVLKTYDVDLGFAPEGDKAQEGDGRTPEGNYLIDRRNPNSQYHLSLGISYPNAHDVALARAAGVEPGGDIFIHGRSWRYWTAGEDWTAGCIAVRDREIREIYAMVQDGTPIDILP
ncbi:MAG: L,D-transpeptidase family protein [Rhodobacteraceae bacterium]|nr:L,D-transpeptidase family protein [Paracoccaceae bacterium]